MQLQLCLATAPALTSRYDFDAVLTGRVDVLGSTSRGGSVCVPPLDLGSIRYTRVGEYHGQY